MKREKVLSSVHHIIRDQELERLFQLGAIEELPYRDIASCVVNDIFVVPKPHSTKFRPIIDQRFTNSFTKKVHFKMESMKDVKDIIQPEDLMIRIDFKDAYLHLFYRYVYRKFGAFWWRNQLWMFKSMMFGHTHAPRWWTKVMKPVVTYLRKLGIRCVIYIDDLICFLGSDATKAREIAEIIIKFLGKLGITVNFEKSITKPSKRVDFLGFIVDSHRMKIFATAEKMKRVKDGARELLRGKSITVRKLAKFLGMVTAMAHAVLPWRLRSRAILAFKNKIFKISKKWDSPASLTEDAKFELRAWINCLQEWNGRSINDKQPRWTTVSDSSATGFGGISRAGDYITAQVWEEDRLGRHSTRLETWAAVRVIREFILHRNLKNGVLLHESDNTTTVSYLNKQGGRIPEISEEVEELWNFCLERNIVIHSNHVPGVEIPNVDFLSRISQDAELSLPDKIFRKITEIFGTLSMDLFASRQNRKLQKFVTLLPDSLSYATDAFSIRWPRNAYAFPPFNQIGRILSKVRREWSQIILLTPLWESATWWPSLHQLTTQLPFVYRGTLWDKNQRNRKIKWPLVVWSLSGNPYQTEAFQRRLSSSYSLRLPTKEFMIPAGMFLELGV